MPSNSYNEGGDRKIVGSMIEELEAERLLVDTALDLVESMLVQSAHFGTVAASTDDDKPVFVAPFACTLGSLFLINAANLPLDGTNNTVLTLVNKGADGTGTAVIATFDNETEAFLDFVAVEKVITAVTLVKGDVLSIVKTDAGTGAVVSDLQVAVSYKPVAI